MLATVSKKNYRGYLTVLYDILNIIIYHKRVRSLSIINFKGYEYNLNELRKHYPISLVYICL